MKSPSKDAAPTDGVQAYMKSATDNFQRIYSIRWAGTSGQKV